MTSHDDKAEKKAAAKAALARAKLWSEEQRRGRSPGATTVKASEPSPKKERVQSDATSPVATIPDIQYRKTPSTLERTQARARASGRSTEIMNTTRNLTADDFLRCSHLSKLSVRSDMSANAEDFKSAHTTERVHEALIVVSKAHMKEMLSITNDFKKLQDRLEVLCDAMANANHDDSVDEIVLE